MNAFGARPLVEAPAVHSPDDGIRLPFAGIADWPGYCHDGINPLIGHFCDLDHAHLMRAAIAMQVVLALSQKINNVLAAGC